MKIAYTWLKSHDDQCFLDLYIQPGAKKEEIIGEHANRLKIKIQAKAQDGLANKELIKYLSKVFSLAQNQIEIVSGEHSRQKRVLLKGIKMDHILRTISESFEGRNHSVEPD